MPVGRGTLPRIEKATAELVGHDTVPAAIVLTHDHPDHAGAARALAERWACRVFVHPAELAIARGNFPAMWRHAGPLDRYVILPAISALGPRRRDSMLERNSLTSVIEVLGPDGGVPCLPGWRWVHTPGHTPGHVSFYRAADGVLISGDALDHAPSQCARGDGMGSPGRVRSALVYDRRCGVGPCFDQDDRGPRAARPRERARPSSGRSRHGRPCPRLRGRILSIRHEVAMVWLRMAGSELTLCTVQPLSLPRAMASASGWRQRLRAPTGAGAS